MSWLDESAPGRRPVVFVEDHLYHTTDLLSELRRTRPDLPGQSAIVVLDRPGPDTDHAIRECRSTFPDVAVAVPDPSNLADSAAFSRFVARRLRPSGLLIQDVQLATLPFIACDRWWESIYLAATVRGMFRDRTPVVRFLSNKRGYSATFGREMVDAGFDPRDVMEKAELTESVAPALAALFDRQFPWAIEFGAGPGCDPGMTRQRVPISMADRGDVDSALDLVLWRQPHQVELSGRAVAEPGKITLRAESAEAETWSALIAAHFDGGDGLPVVAVGARVGPPQAERAELTNLAARHIHTLRSRLRDAGDLLTVQHAYRLHDRIRAGLAQPRATFASPASAMKVQE